MGGEPSLTDSNTPVCAKRPGIHALLRRLRRLASLTETAELEAGREFRKRRHCEENKGATPTGLLVSEEEEAEDEKERRRKEQGDLKSGANAYGRGWLVGMWGTLALALIRSRGWPPTILCCTARHSRGTRANSSCYQY